MSVCVLLSAIDGVGDVLVPLGAETRLPRVVLSDGSWEGSSRNGLATTTANLRLKRVQSGLVPLHVEGSSGPHKYGLDMNLGTPTIRCFFAVG